MVNRYYYRKIDPDHMSDLMKQGDMQLNDYLALTGRDSLSVQRFLDIKWLKKPYVPGLAEALLVELVAQRPDLLKPLLKLAWNYRVAPPNWPEGEPWPPKDVKDETGRGGKIQEEHKRVLEDEDDEVTIDRYWDN